MNYLFDRILEFVIWTLGKRIGYPPEISKNVRF